MDNLNQADRQNIRFLLSKSMPQATFALLDTLYQVTMILLGWWSLPLEVLLRREFGERYLSILRILITWWVLSTFTFFYSLFAVMTGNPMAFLAYSGLMRSLWQAGMSGLAYHLFYYSFFVAVIFHRYRIWKRAKDEVPWLSTCFGVSHLAAMPWNRLLSSIPYAGRFIQIDDWFLYRFLEPALCFVLSRLVSPIDGLLGAYILIASVALFIKNNMVYGEARGRVLDMIDGVIESTYLADALAGRPKELLAGFSVVPMPVTSLLDADELDIAASVRDTLDLDDQANL